MPTLRAICKYVAYFKSKRPTLRVRCHMFTLYVVYEHSDITEYIIEGTLVRALTLYLAVCIKKEGEGTPIQIYYFLMQCCRSAANK